ncbi:hypothetical protein N7468_002622 [Penicillium chermesinum]|uniref:Major facilitator superfamily (MFS) profile domain-containing protein n=1 Tax=Penicillium chermesinum TaxID=63820 RepID=A0A9W9PIU4_9EURO|nr:uncharacterized protein N7468_002622 [Penicillium chermesinum]KAJ5247639.1 hypothetical protein N7468_002622 [Penicillium chermesinum]KAJ6151410.1 hypothetical protein N7470_007007 [Penicillium chermesinum]
MSKPTSVHDEDPAALKPDQVAPGHVSLTDEENKRIRRKTDRTILVIVVWVYFLQILDKSVLGYGATFGLQADTGLTGNQYSLVGSIAPIAQLCWLPFSSYLIVKVPPKILMPGMCLGWGIAQTCMAAAHDFGGLMATRFLLGLFEAGCLPLFSVLTSQWYLRAEQPIRVAAWYGTNGIATIVAAALSYGLAHINSNVLESWQMQVFFLRFNECIFLFVGCLTIASVPFVYWRLDNDISSARFLTEKEKLQGIERLRANQTGTGSNKFKFSQVFEAVTEPKTYLWIGMALLLNIGASVTNTFGPLIIGGLGFDKYKTSLMTMPFGVMQFIAILLGSYLAQTARLKGVIIAIFMLPVVAGLALLYALPRNDASQGGLLAGYYLLGFLFGANPLIVSWIVGNTAGTTKKSVSMSLYNAAVSAGNIVGPLLFTSKDAPTYHPGLQACLGIFCALIVIVLLQWVNLWFLNKLQARRRVRNGKSAKVIDYSMQSHFRGVREDHGEGMTHTRAEAASEDVTDRQNDEFVYIY